jgi:azurin
MFRQITLFSILLFCSPIAWSKTCAVTIDATDQMLYNMKEIDVAADCTEVRLTLEHIGKLPKKVMGHSWVLAKTEDVKGILNDGRREGLDHNYTKPNDPRIIAETGIIPGGDSKTITFSTGKLKPGGDYTYFCTFPGHETRMHGPFKFGV